MLAPAKKPAWVVLGTALVFHTFLLSLQANHRPGPGVLRGWILDALVPLEKLVDRSVHGVWSVWDGYVALIGVRNENEQLRDENGRLQMELRASEEAKREAERLRAFWGLANPEMGKTVVARVVGRDPTRTLQTVTIDKGQAHGLRQNASVMTASGVVGRAISVASRSAVVQLITDAQSSVGVLVGGSRIQAVFKGTGGRDLELEYIDDDSGVAVGDEIITSGLDLIHPKGLPLGVVTSVAPGRGPFKAVAARPRADMGRLEEVLVVTELAPIEAPALPSKSPPAK